MAKIKISWQRRYDCVLKRPSQRHHTTKPGVSQPRALSIRRRNARRSLEEGREYDAHRDLLHNFAGHVREAGNELIENIQMGPPSAPIGA